MGCEMSEANEANAPTADAVLSDAEIAEMQALCERATPGPWTMTFERPDDFPTVFLSADKSVDVQVNDMNFVDQARTFIPKAIAAIAELKVQRDTLFCLREQALKVIEILRKERDSLANDLGVAMGHILDLQEHTGNE
jgi:hypothetical protein